MNNKLELVIYKIACWFGVHDWHENELDQVFYPNTLKCFWCGKRKNQ